MNVLSYSETDECADNVPQERLRTIFTLDQARILAKELMPDQGMQLTDNFALSLRERANRYRAETGAKATLISHIGRRGGGIEALVEMLATHPLDRTWENYGNFAYEAEAVDGTPIGGLVEGIAFSGNFFTYSFGFYLVSNEADVIERLTAAIRANQLRADYLDQPPPFNPRLVTVERHRFSTTQGEASVFYDGELVERFGDDIRLQTNGQWEGYGDRHWQDVARRVLAERHAKAREKAMTDGN